MGYRSLVTIRCEKRAFELFKKAYTENKFEPDQIMFSKNDEHYLIRWAWVKWYEDYPDVQAIESVMDKLDYGHEDGSNDGFGYRFIRIGEEDEDIEYRENDCTLELYIVRDVEIPSEFIEVGDEGKIL